MRNSVKTHLAVIVGAGAFVIAAPAFADTIDFGQFQNLFLDTGATDAPLTGVTRDGVGFTIAFRLPTMVYTGPTSASDRGGAFAAQTPLLSQFYVADGPGLKGANLILFHAPIDSLEGIAFQPYNPTGAGGTYLQSITAYGAGDVFLDAASATVDLFAPEGSIPFLSVQGPGISFVEVLVTKADAGFVWGSYVPEPSTWALMIAGFGSVGAMIRRRRTAAA